MKKPFIIGLITARSGSVRLPNKNIKDFCWHPLLAWSIMQSRASKYIDETILTTDSEEYAEIGDRYGAKVILRPVLDNDISASVPLKMAIKELENNGYNIDNIVYLLPTSPLRKTNDLDDIIYQFNYTNTYLFQSEIIPISPDRECFIYKNYDYVYNRKSFFSKLVIADKLCNYSRATGGWGIAKKDYLMAKWNNEPELDSIIDSTLEEKVNKDIVLSYAIEPWQCFETDTEDQFRLCELIMENYILKGQGMHVYIDYAKKHGKEISYKEIVNRIFLSKYIGNNKQG